MNKKGFTLMELLSVTIVIAIISTIAFLVVTKFINEAKKDSAIISLKGYVKSVNNYLASCSDGEVDCVIKNDYRYFVEINSDYKTYEITKLTMMDFFVDKVHAASEILDLDESVYLNDVVDAKGILPKDGFFDIIDGEVKQAVAVFNDYRVIYSEDKYYIDGYVVPIPTTDIKLSKSTYTLVTGDQVNIVPTPEPINTTDKRIEYTSIDESIATIDKKGILTVHKLGDTIIKITIGKITKEINIKVRNFFVSGDTVYENTLYDFVESRLLKDSGSYTINLINNEVINAEVYILNEDTTYAATPTLCDNVTDTKMCIYKYKGNLTVNSGVVIRPQVRKKGFLISVNGKLTNNGEISMTARGAIAAGQNLLLFKNNNDTFETLPAIGGAGGVAVRAQSHGYKGVNGISRQTGGGGSGSSMRSATKGGNGSAGTSYSGGSGGGGAASAADSGVTGGNAASNGGAGGVAVGRKTSSTSYAASGGAGNASGRDSRPTGSDNTTLTGNAVPSAVAGTGGLLIIYANNLENNGIISSNGSSGKPPVGYNTSVSASGGSSGGGSINIFYFNYINNGTISAAGGITTIGAGVNGGNGGDGCVSIGNITTGLYTP